MGTLPQLIAFQPPQMNLADSFTAMARLAAYDQARRTSLLEQEEKRGRLDREQLWRQTIAGAIQPPQTGPGFAAAQPQTAAVPQPPQLPQEPTMPPVGVPVPVNTQTGEWGQPGGFTAAQPPALAAMAPPVETTQPPLQGGGFTPAATSPSGQPMGFTAAHPAPQGFTAPQPPRPLSASVPGLMPMPNAEAVQRAFAIDPERTSQWYGAYLTQRGKQLDEVNRNNKLVYQVTSAILEQPEYYQQGIEYLREQGVPVPKNLPPTYNAALVAFHRDLSRQRLDPLQDAQRENQLAQAKLHEAQAKDVPYRTELERTRLGLQGTTATMNDELRNMGVNPATATPEQRQQAQKNIQQRELAKEGEAQRLKFEQEENLRETQPLQDARKDDSTLFVSKATGQSLPGTLPYGDVKKMQQETDPEKGAIKVTTDDKKQLTTLKQLEPVLQQYRDLVEYAYGTDPKTGKKGPMADYTRSPWTTVSAMYDQLAQSDPVFQAKRRALQGQLQSVVRGLGARGDLNESELKAATEMIANMDASLGLGLSLGVGIGTGGVGPMAGIKPSISIPDTPETGINLANELIGTVNRRIGSILQYEGYSKTPYITMRTDQAQQPQPGVMPRATAPPPSTEGYVPGEFRPQPTPTQPPARGFVPGEYQPPPPPAPTPGRQSQAQPPAAPTRVVQAWWGPQPTMSAADIEDAIRQTGRSRAEVIAAARARGYTVPTARA